MCLGGFVYSCIEDVAQQQFDDTRDGIFAVQFSPDGKKLIVGGGDGSIDVSYCGLSAGNDSDSCKHACLMTVFFNTE